MGGNASLLSCFLNNFYLKNNQLNLSITSVLYQNLVSKRTEASARPVTIQAKCLGAQGPILF